MASIAASVWPRPIALIPCLSWSTASCVFTRGVMSGSIPWHLLENQYFSNSVYRKEFGTMIYEQKNGSDLQTGPTSATERKSTNVFDSIKTKSEMKSHHILSYDEPSLNSKSNRICREFDISNTDNNEVTNGEHKPNYFSSLLQQSGQASLSNSSPRSLHLPERTTSNSTKPFSRKESCTLALQLMREIMDEFTHLGYYSTPVDPTLIIIVAAKDDAYVLREGVTDLTEIWPGAEVRYINAGHIASFLFKQSVFRQAIIDAFDRVITKYYNGKQ